MGILSHAWPRAYSFPRGGIVGGIRNRSSSAFDPGTKFAMKARHGLEAPGVGFHIVGERNEALDRSPFAPLFRLVVITLRTAVEMRRQGSLDRPWPPLPLLRRRRPLRTGDRFRMRRRSTRIRRNLFSYDLGESRWDAIANSIYVLLFFRRLKRVNMTITMTTAPSSSVTRTSPHHVPPVTIKRPKRVPLERSAFFFIFDFGPIVYTATSTITTIQLINSIRHFAR